MVTSQLRENDEKGLDDYHTKKRTTKGDEMASQEQLAVHGDLSIRKVVPLTEGPIEKLAEMWKSHKNLPTPPQVGSVMKIPPPKK